MLRSALSAAILSVGVGLSALPAHAQMTETTRVPVPTHDLNLRSPAGQKTLDRRLDQAADQACGEPGGLQDLSAMSAEHRCRNGIKRSGKMQAASIVRRQEMREQARRAAATARAARARRAAAARSKHRRAAQHRPVKHAAHRQTR